MRNVGVAVAVLVLVLVLVAGVLPVATAETTTFTVSSPEHWSGSGVTVQSGQHYALSVPLTEEGESQVWYDWWVESTADGYVKARLKPFEGMRRIKTLDGADWFTLVCCAGQTIADDESNCAVVGQGVEDLSFPDGVEGEFSCFPNDVYTFYWNNEGDLNVEITELDG